MHRLPRLVVLTAALVTGALLAPAAGAQPYGYAPLAYSGTLEHDGEPVEGSRSLRFGLFLSSSADTSCLSSTSGACPYWSEQHDGVVVKAGRFSVALGETNIISSSLLSEPALYLGVAVEDAADQWIALGGLQRLLAVPRAARTEQIVPPVGSIIAWHPNLFPQAPALPAGWVRCQGQTLNDPQSPLDGRTIPNLNGQGRFLRGAPSSGALQDDQLETHTHLDSGHTHAFARPRWFYVDDPNGGAMLHPEGQDAAQQFSTTVTGYADLREPVALNGDATVRHGAETRPTNMGVVWIMRVR